MLPTELRPLLLLATSLLALVGALVWREIQGSTVREQWSLVDHTQEVRFRVVSVVAELDHALLAKRGYLLTGDARQLEDYRAARIQVDRQVAELATLSKDHPDQELLHQRLRGLLAEQDRVSAEVIARYQQGGVQAAGDLLLQSHDPARHREIQHLLEECAAMEERLLGEHRAALEEEHALRRRISGLVAALATLACIAALVNLRQQFAARRERLRTIEDEKATLAQRVDERTRELQQTLHRLSEAQAIARLGHWYLDLATGTGTWSAQMHHLTERPVDHGAPPLPWFLDRIHPEDRPALETHHQAAVSALQPFVLRFRWRTEASAWRWMETRVRPVTSAAGTCVALEGTLQDIHELASTEAELRAINAELEERVALRTRDLAEKNRQLEAFTYSVSHDLKAPLRGIEGYGRLLEMEKAEHLDEEGRQFIATIRAATRQMGQLIDDLLAYSRLERRTQRTAPVQVDALVRSIVDTVARDPDLGHLRITADLVPLTITTDQESLAIILRNLVDNAVKFSRERPEPHVGITMQAEGSQVTITVTDNGIGFDDAYRERIFEIFQRLNHSERYPGTGVGLALVRRATELLGGSCEARGEPGRGARFTVRIPR